MGNESREGGRGEVKYLGREGWCYGGGKDEYKVK